MAGLWQWYQDQQGYSHTFAIVTTAANALIAPIHGRMPAILDEGDSLALCSIRRRRPATSRACSLQRARICSSLGQCRRWSTASKTMALCC
jgi:hypothetical protein